MARESHIAKVRRLNAEIRRLHGRLNTSFRDADSAIKLHAVSVDKLNEDIRTALEIIEDERRCAAELRRENRELTRTINSLKDDLARGHRAMAAQAEMIDQHRTSELSRRVATNHFGEENRVLTREWLRQQRRLRLSSGHLNEQAKALHEGQD